MMTAFQFSRRAAIAMGGAYVALAPRFGRADTGPSADLWDRWLARNDASTRTVDNTAYAAFLKKYVVESPDGVNRVAYGRVDPADKAALDVYVAQLEAAPVSDFSAREQLPYWINVYNAATVKMIVDHYPLDSITDVPLGGFFSFGPWGEKILTIEGEEVSLDDVEHRIIRPVFKDPRIHYGVNCASIGCPNLAVEPFTADNIERLFDEGAKAYVGHERGAKVTGGAGTPARLTVSSIYSWFESDFDADGGVVAHLQKYATPEKAARVAEAGEVFGHNYDWSLNDADAVS